MPNHTVLSDTFGNFREAAKAPHYSGRASSSDFLAGRGTYKHQLKPFQHKESNVLTICLIFYSVGSRCRNRRQAHDD